MVEINKKLISFFEEKVQYFGVKFLKKFKLYEHRRGDPPRTFRFKFWVEEREPVSDYSSFSKKRIIEEIKRLAGDEESADKLIAAYQRAKKLGISDRELGNEIVPEDVFQEKG